MALLVFAPVLPSAADTTARRVRIKDVATIEGVRDNQLIGYGIVVGLSGTGDSQQTLFPVQTLISTLQRMGVNVPTTGSAPRRVPPPSSEPSRITRKPVASFS